MKAQDMSKDGKLAAKGWRMWALFGVLVATLICSGIVGLKSVAASASCTTAQCDGAFGHAHEVCLEKSSDVIDFICPLPGSSSDDFFFRCENPEGLITDTEIDDCSTFGPS